MVCPDTVIKIRKVVPCKHKYHAVKELLIFERKSENFRNLRKLSFGVGIFLSASLHNNVYYYKNESYVTEC